MTAYARGAVTLTAGSATVTGRLTTFANMSAPGDLLCHGGVSAVVRRPISNTEIELLHPWRGPSVVETSEYAILHVSSFWSSNVTTNEKLLEIVAKIEAGLGWKADATGSLAERADFDGAQKGFVFMRTDSTPITIYVKQSGAAGDWSAGTPMTGQGLPGDPGPRGDPFKVDATGPFAGRAQFDGQPEGFAYLSTDTGALYIRETAAAGVWSDPVPFGRGDPGREVELRKSATHVQWRYVDDASWADLVALADLRGADGREVKIRATATHIQWQYAGDLAWTDIVALADIEAAGQAAVADVVAARNAALAALQSAASDIADARDEAIADVQAVVAPATTAAQSAVASASAAEVSADAASTSASGAAASKVAAETARDGAVAAQTGVSDARDQAVAAAATAQHSRDWATAGEDVAVNDGANPPGFSARHWAIKAAQSAEFDPDLYLTKAGNLGGINDPAVARSNLQLGSAATAAASAFATSTQGALADTAVQPARSVSTGTGLTGGGDLSANRTIALSPASVASLALADTAVQPAGITGKEDKANKGVAGGYASLDGAGKIPEAQIPAIAITDTFEVASQSAMLALTAQRGDVAIRSDINKSFVLSTDSPATLADWKELRTPTDAVLSVAGKTGAVTLTAADVGVEASADVTDASNVGAAIHGSAAKTTPVDADTLALINSAASNALAKVTWANVKATLKAYFDGLYALLATVSEIRVGTSATRALGVKGTWDAHAPVAVNLAALDMSTFINGTYTQTGAVTVANPANPKPGQSGTIVVTRDGSFATTFGANWQSLDGGGVPSSGSYALSYYVNAADWVIYSCAKLGA